MKAWPRLKQLLRRLIPPFCANVNRTNHGRRCLLIYITESFRRQTNNGIHQNREQVLTLASVLGGYGYDVDVVDWYHLARARLRGPYHLVIDHRPGISNAGAHYAGAMAPSAQRVGYFTTSNPSWQNAAEAARIDDVYRRRGARLMPRRQVEPLSADEIGSFDSVWFMGNEYNRESYTTEFRLPPTSYLRNTGYRFPVPPARSQSPTRFIFLGGSGQVHKGLDLLLEVFAKRPRLTLYVCGHYLAEADFCAAYRKELFNTPNVVPMGFMDVHRAAFQHLASQTGYHILPSCAEAGAGSVLTAMSAGLIPIVSRECGYDGDIVQLLPDCSLQTIGAVVDSCAIQSSQWVDEEAARMRAIAQTEFNIESYANSVRAAIETLTAETVDNVGERS